jgi:hypothetical protein
MEIVVARIRKLWKIPYASFSRMGSETCYRVWADNELVYDGIDVGKVRFNKKEVLAWVKKKYGVEITEIKDCGSLRVDG